MIKCFHCETSQIGTNGHISRTVVEAANAFESASANDVALANDVAAVNDVDDGAARTSARD